MKLFQNYFQLTLFKRLAEKAKIVGTKLTSQVNRIQLNPKLFDYERNYYKSLIINLGMRSHIYIAFHSSLYKEEKNY